MVVEVAVVEVLVVVVEVVEERESSSSRRSGSSTSIDLVLSCSLLQLRPLFLLLEAFWSLAVSDASVV